MYPYQMTSSFYRNDLMRDAERQRLAAFVTCCAQSPLLNALARGVQAVAASLRGTGQPASEPACCAV